MAMRDKCKQAVSAAIGRPVTAAETKLIEQRIASSMKQVAMADPAAWRQLSLNQRMALAGQHAGQEILAEAAKKQQRIALTVIAHDKLMNRYSSFISQGLKPFHAIAKVLDDAAIYAKGVSNEYFSGLIDTFNAVDSHWLGMIEDARQSHDLVKEIFGEDSQNPAAKKGAQAWLDTVEAMRTRFNAAGGDVGKLDYGYIPQPHDAIRVIKSGMDKWGADIMPLLDRKRYIDENGVYLDDARMKEFLEHAYETISTGGLNKLEPGKFSGNGSRANRGSDHRVIHFKDADSYLTYAKDYNRGGILSSLQGHVGRLAKDIALIEEFGPNPANQFGFLHDTAKKTGATDLVGPYLVSTKNMFDVLNGTAGHVANVKMAEVFQAARNIEVFGKLGSALISSITDIPTYLVTTGFNNLGTGKALTNLIRAFGGDTADYANRAGLIAESVISDMNRWAEGNIGKDWSGKLANVTMKASLLEGWTDALRRGFSITMMGALGKMSRSDWTALHASDRLRLEAKGVTADDFAIWKMATPESWRGSDMLTMQSIRNIPEADLTAAGYSLRDQNRAVTKLLGAIVDESEYASLSQDLNARAAVTRSTSKGTVEGEFLRSIMLFKGFPMAMISRHWGRVADTWRSGDKASSVAYGAGLTTALTIFGGLAIEAKDMLADKDPRDATTAKFWGAAFAQGGGVGIFGDLLYTGLGGQNRAGVPNWMNLAGPVVGSGLEAINLTFGNLGESMRGKETHAGAEAVRFAKSHLPFLNLWYAKSAINHAVLQDLQEYLSPGYLSRMKQTAYKDWGQQFYWNPGGGLPDRAPNLAKAGGSMLASQ